MAELVRLAEQKGAAVMNNVASNLIWMFVVCLIAWKAVTFLFWLMQRLCDRNAAPPLPPSWWIKDASYPLPPTISNGYGTDDSTSIFQLPMMACGYYCRLAQGWLAMTLGAACALFQH
ncbi:hypothetical protein PENNAL_c0017G01720 [Penicillium nalgiovense]|uniref:Uncharacterized protein n=1 Tax=Penicillium nalgiovense TaxID=60175 RepID=A0A1V6YM67_PENNA|nr:hypothetical protein PENNAL_c0017G01720 [Penicillium nalgiovense]